MVNRLATSVVAVALAACGGPAPSVRLDESWPAQPPASYEQTTAAWTRQGELHGQYQETLDLRATFKSPDWRAAHAQRDADHRGLSGAARDQVVAQAQADMTGPYEIELMVATWDRKENDLDRGKKSVWHVVLLDEQGKEIEPLEIVKDRRPTYTMREEFPQFGDFDTAYIARFPRTEAVLGPSVRAVKLRMSSERGAVELIWAAQ